MFFVTKKYVSLICMDVDDKEIWALKRANRILVEENTALKEDIKKFTKENVSSRNHQQCLLAQFVKVYVQTYSMFLKKSTEASQLR